ERDQRPEHDAQHREVDRPGIAQRQLHHDPVVAPQQAEQRESRERTGERALLGPAGAVGRDHAFPVRAPRDPRGPRRLTPRAAPAGNAVRVRRRMDREMPPRAGASARAPHGEMYGSERRGYSARAVAGVYQPAARTPRATRGAAVSGEVRAVTAKLTRE